MPDTIDQDGAEWVQTPGWRWVETDYERRVLDREHGRRAALALYQRVMAGLIEYARRMPWR